MDGRVVCVARASSTRYAGTAPFEPSESYPELPRGLPPPSPEPNPSFEAVRECLRLAGLDASHFGTEHWNPLGALLRPGETVLLKPNLVKESHPRDPAGWTYVLTHGSLIRAVAEYVFLAVGPQGAVVVADAPQTDSKFSVISELLGLEAIAEGFRRRGLKMSIVDLRKEEWDAVDGVVHARRALSGDPRGYVAFDLGAKSEFHGHQGAGHYYGADYDVSVVNEHHSDGRHAYLLAATPFWADAVISLPKLKTHKKAGVTIGLKNLVGINGDKNWLPHHTENTAGQAGDESPAKKDPKHRAERRLVAWGQHLALRVPLLGPLAHRLGRALGRRVFGDTEAVVRSGNWWGNDTVWRMCLDLNKLLLWGRPDGTLRAPEEAPRRHLCFVDGIVAGQGRGPMNPDPMEAGLVAFGSSVPSVDAACAVLMGFEPRRIPIVANAFRTRDLPLTSFPLHEVRVRSNVPDWEGLLDAIPTAQTLRFEPHFGWKGHIERGSCSR